MLKSIPFTLKSLLRNRRRTLLTIASIAMSLLLVGVLLSVYSAFYSREAPSEETLRLIVRHRVSLAMELPQYDGSCIRAVDGVEALTKFSWGTFTNGLLERKTQQEAERSALVQCVGDPPEVGGAESRSR